MGRRIIRHQITVGPPPAITARALEDASARVLEDGSARNEEG